MMKTMRIAAIPGDGIGKEVFLKGFACYRLPLSAGASP